MFKNPFSFSGRIRRTEYGISYIAYLLLYYGGLFFLAESGGPDLSIILLVLWIPMLWFLLAQGAKRCHDRGNTGWYQIIPFYVFWMIFAEGDHGPNEYGPNPKGEGNPNEIDEIGKPSED